MPMSCATSTAPGASVAPQAMSARSGAAGGSGAAIRRVEVEQHGELFQAGVDGGDIVRAEALLRPEDGGRSAWTGERVGDVGEHPHLRTRPEPAEVDRGDVGESPRTGRDR